MSHEIARLLREISYELIAIVVPGLVCGAGVLVLMHHVNIDLGLLRELVKDQPWLLGMVGLAAAYALGQVVQALAHVAIYWLKLPWLLALLVQKVIERAPGLVWLKANRYFRILDVPNDRAEIRNFQKSEIYKRARTNLLQLAGIPETAELNLVELRDMAMAVLGQDSAERHKFLNLSELCLGMASALFLCGAGAVFESVHSGHEHWHTAGLLAALAAIFMLRQPRYYAISEKIVFGQLLVNSGTSKQLGKTAESGVKS